MQYILFLFLFFMGAYIARPKYRSETCFAEMCFVAAWWSAYTCSLKPIHPTLKSISVEDTHVQSIFVLWEPTGILRGPGVDKKLASLECVLLLRGGLPTPAVYNQMIPNLNQD